MKRGLMVLIGIALISWSVRVWGHYPPGITYRAVGIPDDRIPVIDGDLSDWEWVPEEFVLTPDSLFRYGDLAIDAVPDSSEMYPDYYGGPEDFDFRIMVGWNEGTNGLYIGFWFSEAREWGTFASNDGLEIVIYDHANSLQMVYPPSHLWVAVPGGGQFNVTVEERGVMGWRVAGEIALTPIDPSVVVESDAGILERLEENAHIRSAIGLVDEDQETITFFFTGPDEAPNKVQDWSRLLMLYDYWSPRNLVHFILYGVPQTAVRSMPWGCIKAAFR